LASYQDKAHRDFAKLMKRASTLNIHSTCKQNKNPVMCHTNNHCAWMQYTKNDVIKNRPFCGSKQYANQFNRKNKTKKFQATDEYITHYTTKPQNPGYWKDMMSETFD
jgi:hypothetical protein